MNTYLHKIRGEVKIEPGQGFPVLENRHYLPFLEAFHKSKNPSLYFEIGTESGASLRFAQCASIAVDPEFKLEEGAVGKKPSAQFFQVTSDAFFEDHAAHAIRQPIDMAFLDGMHWFEFLLRDFMNTEKYMAQDGHIFMHDCVPINALAAEREWDRAKTMQWTGDVWKLVPILRRYRPDLTIEVLSLRPSGLVHISGFDSKNKALQNAYSEIVEEYHDLDLGTYGLERLHRDLDIVPVADSSIAHYAPVPVVENLRRLYYNWQHPIKPAKDAKKIAIKTSIQFPRRGETTGDFHYAKALAKGILDLGHSVRVDALPNWSNAPDEADFDLVLHGHADFDRPSENPFAIWVIYPGREAFALPKAVKAAQAVFVASEDSAAKIKKKLGRTTKVDFLSQGFDPDAMCLGGAGRRNGLVYVGSNHFPEIEERKLISFALEAKEDLRLWGQGWLRHEAAKYLIDTYLPNEQLGPVYAGAEAVLCDHMPVMREHGFVSNRIYDALACGTPVITDDLRGLPEEFAGHVFPCANAKEFAQAVAKVRKETDKDRAARIAFAKKIRKKYSIQARAKQIVEIATASEAAKRKKK